MVRLPPLYPITDASRHEPLAHQVRRLGEAGFPLVQFRGKPLHPQAQWLALREALLAARDAGGWPMIVVNDRTDLAVLAAAEGLTPWGVHLGQDDLPPGEARRLPGLGDVHLGTSTHAPAEWRKVDPACDHGGVGPFRTTASKGDHAQPIGLAGLQEGCAALRAQGMAPVAIGGLTMDDADVCYGVGAESMAMIGSVARAQDPRELLWQAQLARWRHQPPLRLRHGVVLAGGSGAGKSSLGVCLARRMGLPFLDLDDVIVAATGRTIPEWFAQHGEAAFRAMEVHHARQALATPCVLALGGGAWELEGVRQAVTASGFDALWLAEVPLKAWARVAQDPARPLAQARLTFLERYRQRQRHWSSLPMVLPLGRSPEDLAAALHAR